MRAALKDMMDQCIITPKQHKIVLNNLLHSKNVNSLGDMRQNNSNVCFKGQSAVKRLTEDINVSASQEANTRQDQVIFGNINS